MTVLQGFSGGSVVKESTCHPLQLKKKKKRIDLSKQEPQETWAQFLAWEDPLEGEMAPHSSIPAGIIPQTEEPGGLQSTGLQTVRDN